MPSPTMRTASGRLTAYALSCGYVESHIGNGLAVKMWREHGVYHVKQHNLTEYRRVFWERFPTVAQARARYDRAVKG